MANIKILERKQDTINEITSNIEKSKTVVFFEYHGLSVEDMTELRIKLRNNDSDVKVYKNTLAKRALDSLKYDMHDELNGPKAMAFGNDTILPIKVLSEFAKTHPAIEIKIGVVDGAVAEKDLLEKLANIPSREQLLTMVAAGLMQTVKDFAICLDLHSKNLEK